MDMTIGQIAKVTGYAPESLRALAKKGKLPGAYKLGGRWLVNREEFERHRNGNGTKQSDPTTSTAGVTQGDRSVANRNS